MIGAGDDDWRRVARIRNYMREHVGRIGTGNDAVRSGNPVGSVVGVARARRDRRRDRSRVARRDCHVRDLLTGNLQKLHAQIPAVEFQCLAGPLLLCLRDGIGELLALRRIAINLLEIVRE